MSVLSVDLRAGSLFFKSRPRAFWQASNILLPVIGQNEHRKYFTHKEVLDTLARHGISVIEFHNLNVHRKTARVNRAVANVAAALVRAPFGRLWLNALPDRLIYQRCYVAR